MKSKKNDAEKRLAEEISASVPDVLDNILSQCKARKGSIINMHESKRPKKNWVKPVLATAAAVAIIIGCTLSFGPLNQNASAEGYTAIVENSSGQAILMDIDGSGIVEKIASLPPALQKPVIKLGAKLVAKGAGYVAEEAAEGVGDYYEDLGENQGDQWENYGEDWENIGEDIGDAFDDGDIGKLKDMDLQNLVGKKAEEAVSIVSGFLGSATDKEAVSGAAVDGVVDSFLVTVITKATDKDPEVLRETLMNAVKGIMNKNGTQGAVVCQTLSPTKKISNLAEENGTSEGKAAFMAKLIKAAQDAGIDEFDELPNFDINTLCVLAGELMNGLPDTDISGYPSTAPFVSASDAIQNSLNSIKLNVEDDVSADAELKPGENTLIYDIMVKINDLTIVECNVDAVTGVLLSMLSNVNEDGTVSDQLHTVYVKDENAFGGTIVGVQFDPATRSTHVKVEDNDVGVDTTVVDVCYDKDGKVTVNVNDDNPFDKTNVNVELDKDSGEIIVKVTDKNPFDNTNVNVVIPSTKDENGNDKDFGQWVSDLISGNLGANLPAFESWS